MASELKEMTIEEIKVSALKTLKIFHDFCQKNNLKYSLAYGTLLGAVRHRGFIPWDDDIDVVMPREDYEKLIKTFKDTDAHRLVCLQRNEHYYLNAAKIIDNNTVLIEKIEKSIEIGVFIDIFPLDKLPPNEFKAKMYLKKVQNEVWINELLLTSYRKDRKICKNIFLFFIHFIFGFRNIQKSLFKINKLSQKFNSDNNACFYSCFSVNLYGDNYLYPIEWFDELILTSFEDSQFYIPKRYDDILTATYGDYMTPPSLDKQKSTHTFDVWKKLKDNEC